MALLITYDGQKREVFPENPEHGFTCKELYKLIDCDCIERLDLCDPKLGGIPNGRTRALFQDLRAGHPTQMILDEEGKMRNDAAERYNLIATDIWAAVWRTNNLMLMRSGDHIVGNVVLCSPEEFR